MGNYERFVKAINREETDRILTYDFITNRKLLARYGSFDESKKYAFEQIVEINAKAFKGMGLDATHEICDPAKSWMRSKIENWGRFLGVNPAGWEVTRKGETDWITKRPFSSLKELEVFWANYEKKIAELKEVYRKERDKLSGYN